MYNYKILEQRDKLQDLPEDQAIALKKAFDSEIMDSNGDGIVTLEELSDILRAGVLDAKRKNPSKIMDEEEELQKMINKMINWDCSNQCYSVMIDRLSN